jgi:hypothetical protein
MVTEKKTTKPKVKSSKKPKSKKIKNKTLKLVKSSNSSASRENPFPQGFSIPEVKPPDGFRGLSPTQALMEYGKPLMEMIPMPDDVSKANEVFGIVTTIWNYAIDEKLSTMRKPSEAEMVTLIQEKLGLDQQRAHDFFQMMVERKHFLFPDDIQPKNSPVRFIRKEVSYLISRFDYDRLNPSPEVLPPNVLDTKLVKNLNKLDQYIRQSADDDKLEKLFLKVQDGFSERFNIWLAEKGVSEHQKQFSFIAEVFLDFIYCYEHEPLLTWKDEPGKYLVEFAVDFLLRKTSLEPWEYTLAPSALRRLYRFLYEKEYLDKPPDVMIEFIDILDPHFIEHLKEQFS